MRLKLLCEKCQVEIGFKNINVLRDIGYERLKCHCKDCGLEVIKQRKREFFVEDYKNNSIYVKDGEYRPYWECQYYLLSLEDARKRIDANSISYVDKNAFMSFLQQQ